MTDNFIASQGTVVEKWEIPTRKEDNGSHILPDIAKAILDKIAERQIAKEDVIGVGIGVSARRTIPVAEAYCSRQP